MSVEPAVRQSRSAIAQPVRQGGIRINDVVKIYGATDTGVLAVDHCTFEVPPGEITVVRRTFRLRQDNAAQCHCRLP